MTVTHPGTVLITGPTRGLGRAAVLEMAGRPESDRPDLLLVGRPGEALTEVVAASRAVGATAHGIPADLSRLADVRAAAATARDFLTAGAVRPLRGLVANAGVYVSPRSESADGYEMNFAVNYLAHAQLIGDLRDSFTRPARIVLLGSKLYAGSRVTRMLGNPAPVWRDPVELARLAAAEESAGMRAAGIAYATSKLAVMYYAHELQRHVGDGIDVVVFEPGVMPGTDLGRDLGGAVVQAIGRAMRHLPGMASPSRSGPALASVALDDRWSQLRDGAFVLIDKEVKVAPIAHDRDRERRLWEATEELLAGAP